MCLACPGKVIEIREDTVIVDYGLEKKEASIALVKPRMGDYVLVNTGFIIQIVPKKEALEGLKVWRNQCGIKPES